MSTVQERLRLLRLELGKRAGKTKKTTGEPAALTQDEFVSKLLCSRGAINSVENGNNSLSEYLANDICNVYHVNYQWLMDGEDVPMFVDDGGSILDEVAREYNLNENEVALVEYYLNNPDKREILLRELKAVGEKLSKGELK